MRSKALDKMPFLGQEDKSAEAEVSTCMSKTIHKQEHDISTYHQQERRKHMYMLLPDSELGKSKRNCSVHTQQRKH